jgi:hypothetical protein
MSTTYNFAQLRNIKSNAETAKTLIYLGIGGVAIYLLYTIYKGGKALAGAAGAAVAAGAAEVGMGKGPEATKAEFPLFKSSIANPWSTMFWKNFEKQGIPVHILPVDDGKRISKELYDLLGNPITIVLHPFRTKAELGAQVLDVLKKNITYKTQISNLNDYYSKDHPDLYTDIRDNLYSIGGIGSGDSLNALRAILQFVNNLPTGK